MLIVQSYCPKDQDQAERFAQWLLELGGAHGHKLLLIEDSRVTNAAKVQALYRQSFDSVEVLPFVDHYNIWPDSPNDVFSTVARHIQSKYPQPWFFCEPDCVLLTSSAFDELWKEYQEAKKPFLGAYVDVNGVEPHLSGNAIYPGDMFKHAGNALIASEIAWDCAASDQILPQAHKTKLIAHAWKHPTFENWEQVEREVLQPHPEAVLYHSSKDGSLIDLLREKRNLPVPVLADSPSSGSEPEQSASEARESTTKHALRAETSEGLRQPATGGDSRGGQTFTTDILIKSYSKDYEWLSYCLRAIDKFATGFRRTVLVIPIQESASELISAISAIDVYTNLRVIETIEAGDSYLYQQSVKASAHEFTDADYILHIDSDVILTQPITPESFFRDGKPVWYMTAYDQIDVPWREFTEKFLGEPVKYEFMRRFPQVVPRKLHLAASGFCMAHHKIRLTDYILSQQNREFSEFNALGALAYSRAKEDFHWIDTTKTELPEPFGKQFWSYGGITPEIRVELEKIFGDNNDNMDSHAQALVEGQNIKQTKEGIWVLTNDSHISRWVEEKGQLQHDYQTLPVVLPEIPVGGVVIDIGAFIGDTTGPFLDRVGERGEVIAFEPNPDAFECLRRNCPRASTFHSALGNSKRKSGLSSLNNAGANYLLEEGEVPISTLDLMLADRWIVIDRLDLIKIDCEGYELRVLQGAEQTIAKFRPKMLIEINEEALRRQGTTQAEVLSWLSEHGYQWWPVNQPNLEQNAPQYDILCRYIMTMGDAGGAAEIPPWRSRTETLAELSRLSLELKRFCTAPRLTKIVRDHLRKAGVISK